MKPQEKCANGCDKPPKEPSKIICEDCQKRLIDRLNEAIKKDEYNER
jgi:hypothetical protein